MAIALRIANVGPLFICFVHCPVAPATHEAPALFYWGHRMHDAIKCIGYFVRADFPSDFDHSHFLLSLICLSSLGACRKTKPRDTQYSGSLDAGLLSVRQFKSGFGPHFSCRAARLGLPERLTALVTDIHAGQAHIQKLAIVEHHQFVSRMCATAPFDDQCP